MTTILAVALPVVFDDDGSANEFDGKEKGNREREHLGCPFERVRVAPC